MSPILFAHPARSSSPGRHGVLERLGCLAVATGARFAEVTMSRSGSIALVLSLFAAVASAALVSSCETPVQTFTLEKWDIGGEGGTDYLTAEPGTSRVFVSRSSHVMVVDGRSGAVIGDIPDAPRVHGIALVPKWEHGFTTNAGDSTVTMFDLKTLDVIRKIPTHTGGLDGIMYDGYSDRVILTNHSRPVGTMLAISAETGEIVGTTDLEDTAPEGAASDGAGMLFVNNEGTSTIQVVDEQTMQAVSSWSLAPCEGPTGIAFDPGTEADLLRMQRHFGRIGSGHPESGRHHRQWGRGRRPRLGSGGKAHLHPRGALRKRHGGAPGRARHLFDPGHGHHRSRGQDDLR